MPTGYCMKCKTKREMENFETYTVQKKKIHQGTGDPYIAERVMARGECPECGTKMSRAYGKPTTADKNAEVGNTFVGMCPKCSKSKQIPVGDYMCGECRNEISFG